MIHPFKTPKLSGTQVGWLRPAGAVFLGLYLPALLAATAGFTWELRFTGPPKDGSGYAIGQHLALIVGPLSVSIVMSWMLAPLALLALRAAAMLGIAGWGSAVLAALVIGLPAVHIILMGDLTTEENAILGHIAAAISILGLSVWAAFWGLMWVSRKRLNRTRS